MDQLNLFDDCPVEPIYRRPGKELQTLFQYIKINGNTILFSAIDWRESEPYIAYIRWSDDERYYKATDKKIEAVEVEAYLEIDKILKLGFEELKSRSYKEREDL